MHLPKHQFNAPCELRPPVRRPLFPKGSLQPLLPQSTCPYFDEPHCIMHANFPYIANSKCSNWAATGRYAGSLGSTLPPNVPSCRPQQLWGFQSATRKSSNLSFHILESLLISPNECEELTSSALRTLGWCHAQAVTAHTVPTPPSELTAPAFAPIPPPTLTTKRLFDAL